ncbi:MAG: hypothetical protein K0S44_2037 [Bacteroidetes bacterium]|jgi:hypothetical protein|nr:hypothetical protein [Bacteroidota bacterium]
MKTNVKKLGIVLLALGSVIVSCTKDEIKPLAEDPVESNDQLMNAKEGYSVKSLYVQGVTDLEKKDETHQFKGWKVYFLPDGEIKADNGIEQVKGKWVKIKGDYNEEYIAIDFNHQKKFVLLNNIWKVSEQKPSYYSFEDKDKSDGTSQVVFEM